MPRVRTPVRQRMLIPMLIICWRFRGDRDRDKVQKADLLDYKVQDLDIEKQLSDARKQLDEYEASKQPEVRGRWNRVCGGCGYVNHERHRFCESCGLSLLEEAMEVVHLCPTCGIRVGKHSRECQDCGARFWSPIILHQSAEGASPEDGVAGQDEARM